MKNDDKALLSISLACLGHLVNMLITLELHGIFALINFKIVFGISNKVKL